MKRCRITDKGKQNVDKRIHLPLRVQQEAEKQLQVKLFTAHTDLANPFRPSLKAPGGLPLSYTTASLILGAPKGRVDEWMGRWINRWMDELTSLTSNRVIKVGS